jgi:hypothetical protein
MKVDSYTPEAVFLRPKNESSITGAPKVNKEGEDFASLMDKSSDKVIPSLNGSELLTGASGEKTATTAFLSQSSLAQLQIAQMQLTSQTSQATAKEVTEQVQEALSLLESYAVALGDPENTLKDLAPMAEELSLSADALNNLSKGLKTDDPLKGITDETATIAAIESLKFKRGDFV